MTKGRVQFMDIVIEFVVKDIFKAADFYIKYLGFKIEFTEYKPVSWMQLRNENIIIMLVTYDYAKEDIPKFKDFSLSTNLYKFRYNNLDKVKEIYENLKRDNKKIFLDLRKIEFRYEFGVFDEDGNMILVTKVIDN